MMSDDITKNFKGKSCIQDLLRTIQALQKENEMKDIRIKTHENRIDDLEQYSKMDNVIISGLNVRDPVFLRFGPPTCCAISGSASGHCTTTCIPFYRKRRIIDATDFNWFTRICHTS